MGYARQLGYAASHCGGERRAANVRGERQLWQRLGHSQGTEFSSNASYLTQLCMGGPCEPQQEHLRDPALLDLAAAKEGRLDWLPGGHGGEAQAVLAPSVRTDGISLSVLYLLPEWQARLRNLRLPGELQGSHPAGAP